MNEKEARVDRSWTTSGSLLAGAAAAIGASACCAGPLLLVLMGVGGAWGSRLAALEAYQPWFVGAALVFFGLAFQRLYLRREACGPGEACAVPAVKRRQRALFWVMAAGAAALIGLPFFAPLLY
jgi:mercuric ion transport protein